MKTYEGFATDRTVCVEGRELASRLDVRNHSPDGFAWGYNGSGPAQLALAILLDLYDQETACKHYQEFKRRVIAVLDGDKDWTLTEDHIRTVVREIGAA